MADFCVQCAKDLGFPRTDLAGLVSRKQCKSGLFAVCICEGCGYIQVDDRGNCVSSDCLRKHNKAKKKIKNES